MRCVVAINNSVLAFEERKIKSLFGYETTDLSDKVQAGCNHGHERMVRLLIERGANLDLHDDVSR